MQEILKLASQLGKTIVESSAGQAMKAARGEFNADAAAVKLMREFQTQAEKMARLEHENKPIEVTDKQKLEQLQVQLAGNDRVKKLTAAQMEYMDILRKVSETLQRELSTVEGPMKEA